MTLGNMRANGVGTLLVYCFACHHEVGEAHRVMEANEAGGKMVVVHS